MCIRDSHWLGVTGLDAIEPVPGSCPNRVTANSERIGRAFQHFGPGAGRKMKHARLRGEPRSTVAVCRDRPCLIGVFDLWVCDLVAILLHERTIGRWRKVSRFCSCHDGEQHGSREQGLHDDLVLADPATRVT